MAGFSAFSSTARRPDIGRSAASLALADPGPAALDVVVRQAFGLAVGVDGLWIAGNLRRSSPA
jgi:hypothetical protein